MISETDPDVVEGLKDQGVTVVRRIAIRRDNKQIPTKHNILYFDRSTLTCPKPDNYPRFLIIESIEKENTITSKSVFQIQKFLENMVGKLYEAKK